MVTVKQGLRALAREMSSHCKSREHIPMWLVSLFSKASDSIVGHWVYLCGFILFCFVSKCTLVWTHVKNTLHSQLLFSYPPGKVLWLVESGSHAHTLLHEHGNLSFSVVEGFILHLFFKHDRIVSISRKMFTMVTNCLKGACSVLSLRIRFHLSLSHIFFSFC